MPDRVRRYVAIVDYGMGNLFSVRHACEHVGLQATTTSSKHEILAASAVILPGVGAFGLAMEALAKLDLIGPLHDVSASEVLLIGICLGMQLLMRESCEFGRHRGLGIIDGEVVRLEESVEGERCLKVPQVGWNRIEAVNRRGIDETSGESPWSGTLLKGLSNKIFMYFVHSFYCIPTNSSITLSATRYGGQEVCSSLRCGNVYGFQFHPERSGPQGLQIYRNLAETIQ